MKQQEGLRYLSAQQLSTMLGVLHDIRKRADKDESIEVPLVTLHLCSGRDLYGWLLDLNQVGATTAILFQSPWPDLMDVLYLELSALEAITVHNAGAIPHLLASPESKPSGRRRPALKSTRKSRK